jgi:hypothetical protein
MPRVEIVQKHNTAARRLYIRGTNGKVSFFGGFIIFELDLKILDCKA